MYLKRIKLSEIWVPSVNMYNIITYKKTQLSKLYIDYGIKIITVKNVRKKLLCETHPCVHTHMYTCMLKSRNNGLMMTAFWLCLSL